MGSMRWLWSPLALLLTSLLVPPLGLILLWLRPQTRLSSRLVWSLAIGLLAVGHLYLFFGLHLEFDGRMRPMLRLYKAESHYDALEEDRRHHPRTGMDDPASNRGASGLGAERQQSVRPTAPSLVAESVSDRARPAQWSAFRGPDRDGHYREAEILTDWPSAGLRLLWRQPVGGGYASFSVAQGRAFTIEQRRDQEVVAAYDVETGQQLWTHAWSAEFRESMGGDGPRATPTWDQGRLYALGASGEFHCLDAENGSLLWKRNILTDNGAANLEWGMAASPLVVAENVIVLPGGQGGRSVVAYHKVTGQPIWKSLGDKQAYTAPMVVDLAGTKQLLVVSASRAMGLTLEKGSLLWEYPWATSYGANAAQPILVGPNRFFLSAGYGHGAALVEINPTGDKFSAQPVWENNRMKNKFNGSVLHQDHLYGLDEGILACLEVGTGKRVWKGGRYGYGQVLLAGSHLIVLSEGGDLALVKATPDRHQEVARFSALSGKTWNYPAIAEGRLLVRNTTEMACFDIAAYSP